MRSILEIDELIRRHLRRLNALESQAPFFHPDRAYSDLRLVSDIGNCLADWISQHCRPDKTVLVGVDLHGAILTHLTAHELFQRSFQTADISVTHLERILARGPTADPHGYHKDSLDFPLGFQPSSCEGKAVVLITAVLDGALMPAAIQRVMAIPGTSFCGVAAVVSPYQRGADGNLPPALRQLCGEGFKSLPTHILVDAISG